MRIFIVTLLVLFMAACGSGNSIRVSSHTGRSAIRLNSDELLINSGLLGLPENTDISIDTSSSNAMSFNVGSAEEAKAPDRGSAW